MKGMPRGKKSQEVVFGSGTGGDKSREKASSGRLPKTSDQVWPDWAEGIESLKEARSRWDSLVREIFRNF